MLKNAFFYITYKIVLKNEVAINIRLQHKPIQGALYKIEEFHMKILLPLKKIF